MPNRTIKSIMRDKYLLNEQLDCICPYTAIKREHLININQGGHFEHKPMRTARIFKPSNSHKTVKINDMIRYVLSA